MPARAADMSMMTVIHDAFRRDARRLQKTIRDGRLAGARSLWAFLVDQLHHHHQSEDERLWPMVRAKATDPGQHAVLDAMESEHHALAEAIDAVTDALAGVSVQEQDAAAQAFVDVLDAHLAHEEREAVPLVERLLTQRELGKFERHQKKSMGLSGAAVFFPWLLDELDESRTRTVLAQLPLPLRRAAQGSWKRAYVRRTESWAGSEGGPSPRHRNR